MKKSAAKPYASTRLDHAVLNAKGGHAIASSRNTGKGGSPSSARPVEQPIQDKALQTRKFRRTKAARTG